MLLALACQGGASGTGSNEDGSGADDEEGSDGDSSGEDDESEGSDEEGSGTASDDDSGGDETEGSPAAECEADGERLVQPKRVVRLTFNQQINTIGKVFGTTLAQEIATEFDLQADTARTFPPLANPREGSIVTDSQFQTGDNIAQAVAQHVRENFAEVTGCGEAPTAECGRAYVLSVAEQAFRRPLTSDDEGALLGVFDAVEAEGGSVAESTEYGIYAAFISPHFTYRTELGEDPEVAGRLTPLELASALSYFLADAPPDDDLLEAAQAGDLETAEGIRAQVTRMLADAQVQRNLESAMFAYFQIGTLTTVVIDPARAPTFDNGLRNSMYREAEVFLQTAMWSDSMATFLTGRESFVNERLATLYGIDFPPSGATLDEDGFTAVTLPAERSGLLTLPGFLTARSRPDQPSVVGRGLAVNAAFLCAENPPFPETLVDEIEAVEETLHDQSEREKAEYRMETGPCNGCHIGFDPYGLALDQFDIIGQYREVDEMDRPIDASVTLPPNAGGGMVENAAEMAQVLSQTEAFMTCMSKNLLAYSLAEGGASTRSCGTKQIVERFAETDGSFTSLVMEVAVAQAFTERSAGQGESP